MRLPIWAHYVVGGISIALSPIVMLAIAYAMRSIDPHEPGAYVGILAAFLCEMFSPIACVGIGLWQFHIAAEKREEVAIARREVRREAFL